MKKLISLILVSLILCFSFGAVSVSAIASYWWVMGPDAEYLTYDGYTYYPIYSPDYLYYSNYNYYSGYPDVSTKTLKFEDEETARKYEGSTVTISDSAENYCVSVYLYINESEYSEDLDDVIYVREDYIDEYSKLLKGEAHSYSIDRWYGASTLSFSKEQIAEWLQGEKITIPAIGVYKYTHITLEGCDHTNRLKALCGDVLWDKESGELYLLLYSDFDRNKMYTVNDELTIYKLEKEALKENIIEYLSSEPEDDLEWMNPGEPNYTVLYVLAGIFFGFIPFAVLALSVVMFFVTKTKSYRRGYVLMGIGSILILLAFALMLMFILI